MQEITARNNEKIKYASSLANSASARAKSGQFLLEGARVCGDAAKSGVEICCAYFTTQAVEKYGEYVEQIAAVCPDCKLISDSVAQKLSGTENSQGIFCICNQVDTSKRKINFEGKYLALENIQDPSNFGAVCRSTQALGLDGLIVSGGCDIYNPKALRSAMGSSLKMNIITVNDLPEFINKAKGKGMKTLAAVVSPKGKDIRTVDLKGGVICCIGNEGNGLEQDTVSACEISVTIPMNPEAESLNASVAASILAWELMR